MKECSDYCPECVEAVQLCQVLWKSNRVVCTYVYKCGCMHVCNVPIHCTQTGTVHTYVHTCTDTYNMLRHTDRQTYTYTFTHTYTHTHIYTHIHTHIYRHTHTHTHTRATSINLTMTAACLTAVNSFMILQMVH